MTGRARVICGDARVVMAGMDSGSINTCVTSPPYWGLRDYGQEGQLGLEKTPEEYVENLVDVFRGVWRVLRDDGTLWLNLGDSYASGKGTCYNPGGGKNSLGKNRKEAGAHPLDRGNTSTLANSGLKQKDLVGIPWRVAFALQADGWYLRQDIIWHKPNPMPESVRDRCTKAHEYIFLMSKNKKYYYDHEAIKEPAVGVRGGAPVKIHNEAAQGRHGATSALNKPWTGSEYRNKRSVWTVTTRPYKGAHFATFPPDLIKPCILAGCPKGGMVFDPFGGAATTGIVAIENNRNAILAELNPEYVTLCNTRITGAYL